MPASYVAEVAKVMSEDTVLVKVSYSFYILLLRLFD